jgi:hypothetical protein
MAKFLKYFREMSRARIATASAQESCTCCDPAGGSWHPQDLVLVLGEARKGGTMFSDFEKLKIASAAGEEEEEEEEEEERKKEEEAK